MYVINQAILQKKLESYQTLTDKSFLPES